MASDSVRCSASQRTTGVNRDVIAGARLLRHWDGGFGVQGYGAAAAAALGKFNPPNRL